MGNRHVAVALWAGMVVMTPAITHAQGITRQPLQTNDFPAGYTTVTAIATIAPSACAGRHIHPGLETSYVLEGEFILKIDGKPDQKFKAGDSFSVPIAVKHDGCNPGTAPAKLLGIYIAEKGKPLASPAP
jgi:quercetin dioxygenase-like cupin family protein